MKIIISLMSILMIGFASFFNDVLAQRRDSGTKRDIEQLKQQVLMETEKVIRHVSRLVSANHFTCKEILPAAVAGDFNVIECLGFFERMKGAPIIRVKSAMAIHLSAFGIDEKTGKESSFSYSSNTGCVIIKNFDGDTEPPKVSGFSVIDKNGIEHVNKQVAECE